MKESLEWLAAQLMNSEYVEDTEHITKQEAKEILDYITAQTSKTHLLIVNINIDRNGESIYDLILDNNDKNDAIFSEWRDD